MPSRSGGRGWSLRLPAIVLGCVVARGCLAEPRLRMRRAAGHQHPRGSRGHATRRAERLQDVAISASAFTQEKLDTQGFAASTI